MKLTTIYNEKRPLSWSALSSFQWNKQQWYRKYVLGELPEETPELRFGKMVDEKIQEDHNFLPEVVRYPIMQHKMRCEFNGIPLIGYSDMYDPAIPAIRDIKTGRKPWDKKRADETGQLTMYLFMLYLMDKKVKVDQAQLFIDWLPTHVKDGEIAFIEPVSVKTFATKRSMHDVLKFGQLIKDTWKEMQLYVDKAELYHSDNLTDW